MFARSTKHQKVIKMTYINKLPAISKEKYVKQMNEI